MSILIHCFREASGAEEHFEKSCSWAQTNSSVLVDSITIELGILLERPLDNTTYRVVQKEIDSLRYEPIPDDLIDSLWSVIAPSDDSVPKLMLNEILALSSKNLVRNVPFCYVVAVVYGRNKLPDEVVLTEYQSDSYGAVSRLRDYLLNRWAIDQKSYGTAEVHYLFKEHPPQWQRFSSEEV